MGLGAAIVWDVRNGASDTNGGGFAGGAILATPAAPAVNNAGSGGTIAAGTYFFVVTETDLNGETVQSGQTSTTTSGTTSTITVTAPTNPSVQGSTWNIYAGTVSGGPYWPQSTGLAFGVNKTYTATLASSGTQAPGVDYSQQTGAQVTFNGSTITATTAGAAAVITITGYTPNPATDVGNTLNISGGTLFLTGIYQIIAATTTTWTLDRNCTSGIGAAMVGKMGGAFATIGQFGAVAVSGSKCFVKSDVSISCSNSANISGGKISLSLPNLLIIGWSTNRSIWNLDSSRPTLKAGAGSMTIMNLTGNNQGQMPRNLILDGNSQSSVIGLTLGSDCSLATHIKATGMSTGFQISGASVAAPRAIACQADSCTTDGFIFLTGDFGGSVFGCSCTAVPNGANGFNLPGKGHYAENCIAVAAAASTGVGFVITAATADRCVAYGFSGISAIGFSLKGDGAQYAPQLSNGVAYNCKTNFSYATNLTPLGLLLNCAGGAAGSGGQFVGFQAEQIVNFQTLTGDPFTNAAGGDFSTNNTAGAGALLRALGFPSSYPGLSTSSSVDIGAAQFVGTSGGACHLAGAGGGLAA